MSSEPEIYCPACTYRPLAADRWICTPECGTVWHTFWTGGVCPGCGHAWQHTQCLACTRTSPHRAWYHYPDSADAPVVETEEESDVPA